MKNKQEGFCFSKLLRQKLERCDERACCHCDGLGRREIVSESEPGGLPAEDPETLHQSPKSVKFKPVFATSTRPTFFHRIIHKLITKEKQYIADLDIVKTVFIRVIPLRMANLPVMTPSILDEY